MVPLRGGPCAFPLLTTNKLILMYLISGVFQDKAVEDYQISAQQLIKLFKLDSVVDFKQPVQIDLNEIAFKSINASYTRMSKAGNSLRSVPPVIQGVFNGENYVIRYYTSVSNNVTHQGVSVKKYIPFRMTYKGSSLLLDPISNLEEVLFWILYKGTDISPLRDRRSPLPVFRYVNRADKAKKQYEYAQSMQEATKSIFELSGNMAIYIAKGINIKGQTISRDQCESPEAAKVALINLLYIDFASVSNEIKKPETYQVGVIHDFIDSGLISYRPLGSNTVFYYTDTSEEITTIASEDAMAGFFHAVKDPVFFTAICERLGFTKDKTQLSTWDLVLNAEAAGLILIEGDKIFTNLGGVKGADPYIVKPANASSLSEYILTNKKASDKILNLLK